MMSDIITGIQFLTRIHITDQIDWSSQGLGRSVKYFPVVGAILGAILSSSYYLLAIYLPLLGVHVPQHVLIVALVIIEVIITGGLHCDGFMDTMDGIFSGRSRERMLEIMKDSRVGANGVMSFCLLILLKWGIIVDLPFRALPVALFIMPILGRFAMVIVIKLFPYARLEGMGKALVDYAGRFSLYYAAAITLLLMLPFGRQAVFSMMVAGVFAIMFGRYVTVILGGLTGDVYGATTEMTEILIIFIYLF
jgi:adenosylcobinamide-GDP ribazoletransferase